MDGKPPTSDELLDLTRRQARQIDPVRAEVERLKAEVEQARRAGKRPAAPVSKGAPKAHPQRPGRQAGHPTNHRPAPTPEQVDRTVEVPLPPEGPECHAPLDEAPVTVHDQDQDQIDRPGSAPMLSPPEHRKSPVLTTRLFTEDAFRKKFFLPEKQANSAEFRLFGSKWRLVTCLLGLDHNAGHCIAGVFSCDPCVGRDDLEAAARFPQRYDNM